VLKKMELVSRIGVVLVAATLGGASAFAESRPSNETRGHRGEGGRIQRGSSGERSSASRRDNSSNASRQREANIDRRSQRRESERTDARVEVRGERSPRSDERDRSYRERDRSDRNTDRSTDRADRNTNRSTDRSADRWQRSNRDRSSTESRDRGSYDRSRSSRDRNDNRYDRSRSEDRSRSYGRSPSYGRSSQYRQPYYSHGRVSRVHRYGDGYRIWIVGTPYPFYIPLAYYRHDRFRVGLSISLGGYYNDLGYYDYYDGRSDGAMRGVVESVDYRRDSFVVRNDATGSFVTVLSRDRRLDVRAGDYVELSGEWTRSGVFTAWDVDFLENEYRR
jgi:hypothetical protein